MKMRILMMSMTVFLSTVLLADPVALPESDLQGYLQDSNAENLNFLDAIKKAGNNQAVIAAASKDHARALRKIREKHKVGLQEYYKSAYQQDKAKQEAWRKADKKLKDQFEAKLGKYWKQLADMQSAYRDSVKALRAEYAVPLKEYDAARRPLVQKFW